MSSLDSGKASLDSDMSLKNSDDIIYYVTIAYHSIMTWHLITYSPNWFANVSDDTSLYPSFFGPIIIIRILGLL